MSKVVPISKLPQLDPVGKVEKTEKAEVVINVGPEGKNRNPGEAKTRAKSESKVNESKVSVEINVASDKNTDPATAKTEASTDKQAQQTQEHEHEQKKEPASAPPKKTKVLVSGPSSRSVSVASPIDGQAVDADADLEEKTADPISAQASAPAPGPAPAPAPAPLTKTLTRGPSSRAVGGNTAKVSPEALTTVADASEAPSSSSSSGTSNMPDVLKATEVHAGSVFHNERDGVSGEIDDAYKAQPDDEAYIPISFAKAKIETLTEKLMAMREEHHAVLAQMSAKYEERQNIAKKHYTDFVKRVQAAAVTKLQNTQALLDAADAKAAKERAALMAAHAKEVQDMQSRLATDSRDLIDQQQGDYKRQIDEATEQLATTTAAKQKAEARIEEVSQALSSLKEQYEKASIEIGSSRTLFEKRVIALQVQSDKDRGQLKALNAKLAQQRATTAALLTQAAMSIEALEKSATTSGTAPVVIQSVAAVQSTTKTGGADSAELAAVQQQLQVAQTKVADLESKAQALQDEATTLRERLKIHEDAGAEASAAAANDKDGTTLSADAKQLVVVRKEMSLLEGKLEESRAELAELTHKLNASEVDAKAKIKALESELDALKAKRGAVPVAAGTAVDGAESADLERLEKDIAARDSELAAAKAEVARLTESSKAAVDSAGDVATLKDQLAAAKDEIKSLQDRLKAREEASAAGNGGAAMVPATELDILSKSLEEARKDLADAKAALVADRAAADKDIVELNAKIAELEAAQAAAKAAAPAEAPARATDDAELQQLRDQVQTLEASTAKQQAEIAQLEARLAALSTVKAEGEKLAQELSAKEKELVEFRTKIAELEASVEAAMKAQETGDKVDSTALAAKVAELKADVNSQSEALAATSSGAAAAALEAKNAELQAKLDKLKADYAALEKKKATLAASASAGPTTPTKKGPPRAPPRNKSPKTPDPAVLSKATEEYTDRIDELETERATLLERIATLETANKAAASAAGGDASAGLKLAEENAAKTAEIEELRETLSSVESERDALLAKVATLQAGAAATAEESAEAQVARPVAATLAGVRDDAANALGGKKYSAAKSTLLGGIKAALQTLESGGATAAHSSLKKAYSSALKKKGASGVANALDKVIVNFVVEFGDAALLSVGGGGNGASSTSGGDRSDLKAKLDAATADLKAAQSDLKKAEAATAAAVKAAEKNFAEEKKQLIKGQKATAVKIRQLEAALEKAEKNSAGAAAAKAAADEAAKLEKKMAALEKKHKAELDAIAATNAAAVGKLEVQAKKAEASLAHCQEDLEEMTAEMKKQKKIAESIGGLQEEMDGLRAKAEELETTKTTMKQQTKKMEELEKMYKKESVLRKRYWNMMEDMKGKIRVYCRCRPFAKYELERQCQSVVSFPDDVTIKIKQDREDKEFIYDQCFSGTSTQEDVFEDCRRLVQSAMDGYNVCVFAYGQTGSGKTWTMVGKPEQEGCGGLTPRSIDELFLLADQNKNVSTTTVRCYMIEIYNDQLVDLLYVMTMKESGKKVKHGSEPKLDIKKDSKGMVVIQGAVILDCPDATRTMEIFDAGNKVRHVGSTKMNAESSRSHLIFAVLVEVYDKQTKKTANGKFSFIDLAGSERAGKTGATADRLKEAMSINKSLSALGNVISALSTGEKFIPYRDNKLTLVMSDSLGGNAKTLMFVNVSPADYNQEETLTSLVYASRVKLITNEAKQEKDSAEISRLKKIIHNLKKGLPEDEGADDDGGGGK
eukprot:INCI6542.1.p1 GENE.INCI6542.1~~INCI6542.1.p1  ORF type:complete len:1747 (-),score=525.98 INCI6542.1:581-5821(-)